MAKAAKQAYTDAAGTVVPGVTTILGRFKDSGPLLFWAFKKGMTHGLAGESGARLYDDTKAIDAGTVAHDLVEHWIKSGKDGSDTLVLHGEPEAIEKGKTAFATFLKWKAMTNLELRHTEVPLVSEKYKFGGKLDAIGVVGNELVLVDWKTSNGVYVDYTLQLAGYSLLWEENYPEHPLVGGYHLLRFAKEQGDFAHHHFPKLDTEKVAFIKMRELYDLMKGCEKRVK